MVKAHPSIVQAGGRLEILSSNLNQTLFRCLLCPKLKLTTNRRIQRHMDAHISNALRVQGNIICRCNQPCRPTGHYHCPYCEKTILRKENMETHMHGCQSKTSPPLTLAPPLGPLSASQPCIPVSQEVSRLPCPPTTSAAPPSPPTTSKVPLFPPASSTPPPSPPETHPTHLDQPEEPMVSNASVVDQDHCYTLPFPVSHHSPEVLALSSDIPSASQPEASSTDTCSPEASDEAGATSHDTMNLPSYGVRSLKLARCPHCSLRLYKKNLGAHIQRKHAGLKDITAASHLKNICVDETRGVFAVQKVAHGFSVPIHVQRKTWGNHHQVKCGLEECHKYQLLAKQSGLIYSLCEHIRSLDYCSKIAHEEFLNPEVLEELVSLRIVEESMMETCKSRQKAAEKDHVPFSVLVDLGGSTHQLCLSVHEPRIRSFSCFGRVIVTYNLKKHSWHCPCTNPRKSCPHKSIGKWHVFQTRKDLLPASTQETSHSHSYRATTELDRSVRYTYAEKKIPATLPGDATAPRSLTDYPVCLIPTEETCKLCPGHPRLEEGLLITDKATIVSMSGMKQMSELKTPPEDFDGLHNVEDFWDSVHLEMISRGFFPSSSTNPFVVRPCYENWAPWIGKETRKSDHVLNTEFKKMLTSETEGELSSVTADLLCEELLKQNEATLQSLCKSCSVETSGSRTDLVIRLREKLMNQQTYAEAYESIWGASGGWSVVACPHGIVYSLKFNLQTESPRDFADLLLSWKHFPNVCLYDSAHGLATHTNSRVPDNHPFHPHEGKPAAPTKENLAKAVRRKLKVSLQWLREKRERPEEDGHPRTGSRHRYALHDKLHQSNTKDPHDALRRVDLVPELQHCIKSKAVKHLFADMRKNNYFLNRMTPSTHMFVMRNLIEHRNTICNTELLET
ncbi:uncharacterized protein LOC121198193 isoform X5 [Toxotes jaculatrix]|uniref:uncharacterized protein LOC121198193 isoform X5 n=1 Tax=Toxotes jaculatrix TaxID=941984 RepID=UPI001B3A7DC0|nr:uncharacterized protein LOC121198193 isoform X5 [Toxotes jaculatrix]